LVQRLKATGCWMDVAYLRILPTYKTTEL